MLSYFTLGTIPEFICLGIAVISLHKDNAIAWRRNILYLILVVLIELSGIYLKTLGEKNSWVYNILVFFEISFFSLMFQNVLSKYTNSRLIILLGLGLLLGFYCYELFSHGYDKRHHLTIIILGVVMIVYSLLYFYYLLKDEHYVNLTTSAEFWWVSAVLIYYFGVTTCNIFYPVLSKFLVKPNEVFSYTFKVLNILLYSLWSYSFICRRWLTTKSSI